MKELTAWYRGQRVTVPVSAVTHFVADSKYIEAHHRDGVLILDDTLARLERELPEFIRLHRSILARRTLVTGIRYGRINGRRRMLALVSFQAEPIVVGNTRVDQVTRLVMRAAA